jgi:hypothetical protein
MAVTAVTIGVLISMQRQEQPTPETRAAIDEGQRQIPSLDAIRSAGV